MTVDFFISLVLRQSERWSLILPPMWSEIQAVSKSMLTGSSEAYSCKYELICSFS